MPGILYGARGVGNAKVGGNREVFGDGNAQYSPRRRGGTPLSERGEGLCAHRLQEMDWQGIGWGKG
ncbi:MAG: hypothetical protein IK066_05460, partial [Kiritimatiellae bacterium]|nr:hypothetical protein [Kiritimatiellia bacterium]